MGIMRLVAIVALHAAGVFRRRHLRKPGRLGRVPFVTRHAERGHIGKLRNDRVIFGMFGLWTVARLAGDMCVLSLSPHFRLIVVTHDALVLAGIGNRTLADLVERTRTEMTILAEILRDHRLPQTQEQRQSHDDYSGRPDEVR